jgi:hypothetical protein
VVARKWPSKLSDAEEFNAIADELERPGCFDAVVTMRGRKAVEASIEIESLKRANLLSEDRTYRGEPGEELEDTGRPSLETRRRFCNPFHHFIALARRVSSIRVSAARSKLALRP